MAFDEWKQLENNISGNLSSEQCCTVTDIKSKCSDREAEYLYMTHDSGPLMNLICT